MNEELGDIWPLVLVNRETRQGSRTMDQIERADWLRYVAWMDVHTRHQPSCSILYYASSIKIINRSTMRYWHGVWYGFDLQRLCSISQLKIPCVEPTYLGLSPHSAWVVFFLDLFQGFNVILSVLDDMFVVAIPNRQLKPGWKSSTVPRIEFYRSS